MLKKLKNYVQKKTKNTIWSRGLQTFLSEGHIRYYTLVRGPDFLRRVIVLGKVAFHQLTNY